ncbi:anti-sigma factor [Microbacterium sp. VKM Ac-2870]|uniref:anti-sigma factor n=1 Tax=Microbacterium sp. VKM Ac-2870 TaxID=2783825 RepID=UPI00188CDCBD|nr:anti-sigma factor [Microbacterium sp. VKM Ac-2870]MBF4562925.1 anti-sigma factor [Microbacterium sp. VKM Ac-2870]
MSDHEFREIGADEFAELSAGHAMNALSPDDERAYRHALANHPEWHDLVALDAAAVDILADAIAPVAPPVDLRSRLMRAIEADADVPDTTDTADVPDNAADVAPPTDVVQTVQRRAWSRGLFALVASIVLLVGIGWGTGAVSNLWRTPAAVTALEQIQSAPDASSAQVDFQGGAATAHWSQSVGKVVLVAEGLPDIPNDRTYELWFVRGDQPIAAGTFDASGAKTTAELSGTMKPGDTIAVTIEQAGGSPDGQPTTKPVIAIPTA